MSVPPTEVHPKQLRELVARNANYRDLVSISPGGEIRELRLVPVANDGFLCRIAAFLHDDERRGLEGQQAFANRATLPVTSLLQDLQHAIDELPRTTS